MASGRILKVEMTVNFTPGDLVRARGREWVALPTPGDGLLALRPLSGNENDIVVLAPDLELTPVEAARFDLPDDARTTVQSKAALLADALRLTLRRGAGPFRSAAQLAFEPRTYQLVPLLMALRLQVPRLLIADDVGIGKTIEAGLVLHRLLRSGQITRVLILVPETLVHQWFVEMFRRFHISFALVNEPYCEALKASEPDENPFLQSQSKLPTVLEQVAFCEQLLSASERHSSTSVQVKPSPS